MNKSRLLGAMLSCTLILSSIIFVFTTSSKVQAAIVYGLNGSGGFSVYDPAGIVTGG
jgi:hypothetical protein